MALYMNKYAYNCHVCIMYIIFTVKKAAQNYHKTEEITQKNLRKKKKIVNFTSHLCDTKILIAFSSYAYMATLSAELL